MLINFMSDWRHVWSSDGSKFLGLPLLVAVKRLSQWSGTLTPSVEKIPEIFERFPGPLPPSCSDQINDIVLHTWAVINIKH